MISSQSRPFIAASVPVLREHGLAITRCFYQRMFAAHPELNNLFNLGNQANGSQQQSLAAAVFAYAANIDNAAALAPVMERIVHKHVSVGITPAHYPIVGRHLIAAIAEVLGDAATPPLLAAWDEAYWLLAGELIAAEARLGMRIGRTPGELRTLKVIEQRKESEDVSSWYLQTPDGTSPGRFNPGQYVSVAVDFADEGLRQLRQYSLSDSPDKPWWRISVKREDGNSMTPAGRVSNWLHTHLRPDSTLMVSAPCGDFTPDLDASHPIVLLSAGVGITPMISTLNNLAATGSTRPILFAHATQHGGRHALRDDLAAAHIQLIQLRTAIFYEQPRSDDRMSKGIWHEGRLDLNTLWNNEMQNAEFYLCGPLGFMQQQWQALLEKGVASERIHREVFGPELLDHLL
ncbi:NO-inducible flavohemoprotein [Burkholderiaceae bacterium DAT-1]|nr:NO-inducible flavohemoprotein [Burkholderiaceae bacterium DAT-1]